MLFAPSFSEVCLPTLPPIECQIVYEDDWALHIKFFSCMQGYQGGISVGCSIALLRPLSMGLVRWSPSNCVEMTVLVVIAPTNVTLLAPTDHAS